MRNRFRLNQGPEIYHYRVLTGSSLRERNFFLRSEERQLYYKGKGLGGSIPIKVNPETGGVNYGTKGDYVQKNLFYVSFIKIQE